MNIVFKEGAEVFLNIFDKKGNITSNKIKDKTLIMELKNNKDKVLKIHHINIVRNDEGKSEIRYRIKIENKYIGFLEKHLIPVNKVYKEKLKEFLK